MVRRKRRCRNCTDPQSDELVSNAAAKSAAKLDSRTLDDSLVTQTGESQRLWRHVLYGTATCLGMIEGYANLGMSGDPLPQLLQLSERLQKLIKTFEDRNAS